MTYKNWNKEDFIAAAKEKYDNKFSYDKVEFNGMYKKVLILQGEIEFWQTPYNHLHKNPTNSCVTLEDYIIKANKKYHNKYDYSKVKNYKEKVCIICPEHGEFYTSMQNHVYKDFECPYCTNKHLSCKFKNKDDERKYKTDKFIEESKKKFGDKFSYEKTYFINDSTKVCITDKERGDFWQLPSLHLKGYTSSEFNHIGKSYTNDEWIEMAKNIYGDKYKYLSNSYINARTKATIVCPIHGKTEVDPYDFIHNGNGCPQCYYDNKLKEKKEKLSNIINNL